MSATPPPLQNRSTENRGLAIAHLVLGGLWLPAGIVVSYLLMVLIVTTSMREGLSGPESASVTLLESRPVEAMIFMALFTLVLAALLILSGICLLRSVARWLSLSAAWLSCLMIPVGTILGIWTLLALRRPSARARARHPH